MKRLVKKASDLNTTIKQALVDYIHNTKISESFAQDILDEVDYMFEDLDNGGEDTCPMDLSLNVDKDTIEYNDETIEVTFNPNGIAPIIITVQNEEGSIYGLVDLYMAIETDNDFYCFNDTVYNIAIKSASKLANEINNVFKSVTINDINTDWN